MSERAGGAEAQSELDTSILGGRVRRGFSWSLANSVIRRIWTFAFGIVMARILVPADFGVFVIALATLTILQSMNDLGTAVAVIRWQGDPSRPARTATTISITVSIVMYGLAFLLAPAIAHQLDTPQAIPVLRLLTVAVVLDGFSGIPNALLERAFLQKRRLVADLSGFAVNVVVAVALAAAGYGPWALAWGIVAGNTVVTIAIIVLAPTRPLPGWRTQDARALLAFGLPLAGASLLVFVMLNVDYLVLGGIVGATALGLYLLAFNVSSWPSSLLTVAVRSVSIPALSQLVPSPNLLNARFTQILQLLLTLTFPVAVILGILGSRLIGIVYGEQWVPAASALVFLAGLSVIRVALDFCYDYLVAVGRTRAVMLLQALWVLVLVPALIVGADTSGIRGAAIAHLVVAVCVMTPAFGFTLSRTGLPMRPIAESLRWPVLAALAMVASVVVVEQTVTANLPAVFIGGVVGIVVYGSIALRWWRGRIALDEILTLLRGVPPAA
jgi:O-antigen/teichoic acid export membrane protein